MSVISLYCQTNPRIVPNFQTENRKIQIIGNPYYVSSFSCQHQMQSYAIENPY